jgi:hypothetical protein
MIICGLDSPLCFVGPVIVGRNVLESHGGLLGSETSG